jgi:hypothetical protein
VPEGLRPKCPIILPCPALHDRAPFSLLPPDTIAT